MTTNLKQGERLDIGFDLDGEGACLGRAIESYCFDLDFDARGVRTALVVAARDDDEGREKRGCESHVFP